MRVLEAPKGKPTEKIVFWFLQWHRAAHRKPFTFKYQNQLAQAAGVKESAISGIVKAKEAGEPRLWWFIFTGSEADVTDTSEM